MDMRRNYTLFINTLHKEYRSKTLLFVFLMTIGVIFVIHAGTNFVSEQLNDKAALTISTDQRLMGFYYIINLWSGLLCAIFGVNCIKSDFECGVLPQLLSFPIKKIEYIAARIAGTWFIVVAYYLVSLLVGIASFAMLSKDFVMNYKIFLALLSNSFAILAIICTGVLFSLLFANKIIAFVGTMLTNVFITATNGYLGDMSYSELFSKISLGKAIMLPFHMLFARIGVINDFSNSILNSKDAPHIWWSELIHYLLAITLMLFVINWVFKRRNV